MGVIAGGFSCLPCGALPSPPLLCSGALSGGLSGPDEARPPPRARRGQTSDGLFTHAHRPAPDKQPCLAVRILVQRSLQIATDPAKPLYRQSTQVAVAFLASGPETHDWTVESGTRKK